MADSEFKKGPDGGPDSPFFQMKVQRVPTLRVKMKGHADAGVVIIRKADFDEQKHELLKEQPPAPSTKPEPIRVSEFNEHQLTGMTVENLKTLPEWKDVENKASLTTKDAMVKAILLTREKTKAKAAQG